MNILIVEDEQDIREAMSTFLQLEGFNTFQASSLNTAKDCLAKECIDVIVLDLGLGIEDGVDLLKSDAIDDGIFTIIASARGDLEDRIKGFNLGVDAYLVKPISLDELTAIIHNFARKVQAAPVNQTLNSSWLITPKNWVIAAPDGQTAKLTLSEMKVILRLAKTAGKPVSRDEIVQALGAEVDSYDYRRLEILIRRLRKKIQTEIGVAAPITTVRSVGYAFTEQILVE